MLAPLRILLALLGAAAIAIAASILFLGAEATAWTAERTFSALTGWPGPLSSHWPPTMDSELRFYAALWGAYGVLLLMTARDMRRLGHLVPWLAAVFFVGGLGRLLSRLSEGPPHPFFTLLMGIELALPPILVLLWLGARRRPR